jgi:integrase
VKAPKVPIELMEPISFDTVSQMVKACPRNNFTGDRNAAMLLCLLDTGGCACELLSLDLDDLN